MLGALLRQYIRPYRRLLAAVAGLELISVFATLYLPTVNASIIDDGVAKGDTHTITRLGGVMILFTGLQVLCAVWALYFGSRASIGFGQDLRSAVFDHVSRLSEQDTAQVGTASLLTRTTNDVRQIEAVVQMMSSVLIAAPIMCLGGVLMSIHQDLGLSWLLLVSVPVMVLANYLLVFRMLPFFRKMQNLMDSINRVVREQLSGVRVIRAFACEHVEEQRFAAANRAVFGTMIAVGRWQVLLAPVTTLVINVSSLALIWFGGLRIGAGRMQIGSLIAFLSYFLLILMAVTMATTVVDVLPRASVCAARIGEVLAMAPAITSPRHGQRPAVRIEGLVRLDKVSFHYPGADHCALQNVSITASPGTVTAIIGDSGCGKSTLVSLICRFYDVTAGAVLVDGTDVRDHQTEQLWSAIGLVPQRGYLLAGTVADNLRFAKPDASDAEMWEALRVAAADEFVRAHADGLQMYLAQDGINLSGGQRQMLAIARAVINRPAIYLFDDAFSALDVHTDAQVRAALREIAPDSTVIIVAQRVSTVAAVDQIVVLNNGEVVGAGPHDWLLANCPDYAGLSALQSLDSDAVGRQ